MLGHQDTPEQENAGGQASDSVEAYEEKIEGLERRIAYLERIAEVSQILNSTLELGPLLKTITQAGRELAGTEGCSILLYDDETGQLKFMPTTYDTGENVVVPIENSIAGLIFQKVRPLLIRDVKSDPRWHSQIDHISDFDTRSILGVPLRIKNETIGVLELVNKAGDVDFSQEDIEIATTLAAQAAVAIENARLWSDLQRAYGELAELDRLKSDFVSIASHELRTPLAVMLGYASFLRDQISEAGTEQLEMVLMSAVKLRDLIDSMVNLNHIKSEEVQLEYSIFSMRNLLIEVLLGFQTSIIAKSLRVKVDLLEGEDDPVDIEADRQKIYLIIANLISNAIKFTPEAGFIKILLGRQRDHVQLQIADTGIGIPPEQRVKIFEDFYQVERSLTRRFEGMGLGLPIVKGMVEVHNGKITVDSVETRGTVFDVELPISLGLNY